MTLINPDDRAFIEQHTVYFEQARLDFLHGLQLHQRNRFEEIYQTYLDSNFVLTTWCSACVVDMMKRIADWWDADKAVASTPVTTHATEFIDSFEAAMITEPKRGRGRPRKA